jgi:hypothetical protein
LLRSDLLQLLLTATLSQPLVDVWHDQSTLPLPKNRKLVTHIFQTLQRAHHTVDGGFRHTADLSPNRNNKKKGSINALLLFLQLSEHSPSPQRYGPSAAGAHDQAPSASSTQTGSVSESVAVAGAVLAAIGHSHHHRARREVMTTMCRCYQGESGLDRAPTGHGRGCCCTRRVVGDSRRTCPDVGGARGARADGADGGYRPRLRLSQRRTRRDGKDRRTSYSCACNSGPSGGGEVVANANADVAYDDVSKVQSDLGWGTSLAVEDAFLYK